MVLILNGEKVTKERLETILSNFDNKEIIIYLQADKDTEYYKVNEIMETLKKTELYKLVLIAEKKNETQ